MTFHVSTRSRAQIKVPGQLTIVLKASAVGSNMRQHFDTRAARELFPPDVDVPAQGGDVTLVLPDGSSLQVRFPWAGHSCSPNAQARPCAAPEPLPALDGGRVRGSYACPSLSGPDTSCLTYQHATLVRRPAVDVPTSGSVTSPLNPDPDPEPLILDSKPYVLILPQPLLFDSCKHFIRALRMLTLTVQTEC